MSVAAADSSGDLPALPCELESSASGSKEVSSGLLDQLPDEASSTTDDLEPISSEDLVRILNSAEPTVFELEKYRNPALCIEYTESFIPSDYVTCCDVLKQVLVSHYDLSETYKNQFGEQFK